MNRLLLVLLLSLVATSATAGPFLLYDLPATPGHRLTTANFDEALAALRAEAEAALTKGPWTVTAKKRLPPSGDPHDYMSVGPYWWPNPRTPDGLPYVRRDGETNPERKEYDNVLLGQMCSAVDTLALAYWFTQEARYAERAALLLRVWFVDAKTRMNPNLNYAQAIPGITVGRKEGIIDTLELARLLESIAMLEVSDALTEEDRRGLRAWFSDYLTWLLEDRLGIAEGKARNNHATCYDVQVVRIAAYLGNQALARMVLETAKSRRIAAHVAPDGSQPEELARTLTFSYSCKNLEALMDLAAMGSRLGVDLWNFQTPDGRSIRKALEYLIENAMRDTPWPHEQIKGDAIPRAYPLLRRAARAFGENSYEELFQAKSAGSWAATRLQLLYPAP